MVEGQRVMNEATAQALDDLGPLADQGNPHATDAWVRITIADDPDTEAALICAEVLAECRYVVSTLQDLFGLDLTRLDLDPHDTEGD